MIVRGVPYSLGLDKITRNPEVEILRGFLLELVWSLTTIQITGNGYTITSSKF